MPQDGEILLEKVKAFYSIEDINLVDKNKVERANECRLYFEIFWGIGLAIGGSLISSFNWPLFITSCTFIFVGAFFLIRYIIKNAEINKKTINVPRQISHNTG